MVCSQCLASEYGRILAVAALDLGPQDEAPQRVQVVSSRTVRDALQVLS